jgi:hypothetical protein
MKYIIAIKREARDSLAGNLLEVVNKVPGVEPVGNSPSPWRLQVEATPEGITELQNATGDKLEVEPLIFHKTLSAVQNI